MRESKKIRKVLWSYYLLFSLIYVLIGSIIYLELSNQNLMINILDVGQGDSILIKTPKNEYILVDGGPDNTVVQKLGKFLPFYNRTIDYVILTHADADHLVGLIEVLRRYQVKYIVTTDHIHTSKYFLQWQKEIADLQVAIVNEPKILDLGQTRLYFINPTSSSLGQAVNNASIVFKLEYKNSQALFTGDFENEEILVNNQFDIQADFLKVGHHGADNANSYQFLEQVSPTIAVISVGKNNRFGHPRPNTLLNLEKLGANIFRTDLQGDLTFVYTTHGLKSWP